MQAVGEDVPLTQAIHHDGRSCCLNEARFRGWKNFVNSFVELMYRAELFNDVL